MEGTTKIYSNNIGISFYWNTNKSSKVQVLFKETGFYLTEEELLLFQEKIKASKKRVCCTSCKMQKHCKSILLETPSKLVSLAISLDELLQIEELINGTLFYISLKKYVTQTSKN